MGRSYTKKRVSRKSLKIVKSLTIEYYFTAPNIVAYKLQESTHFSTELLPTHVFPAAHAQSLIYNYVAQRKRLSKTIFSKTKTMALTIFKWEWEKWKWMIIMKT